MERGKNKNTASEKGKKKEGKRVALETNM